LSRGGKKRGGGPKRFSGNGRPVVGSRKKNRSSDKKEINHTCDKDPRKWKLETKTNSEKRSVHDWKKGRLGKIDSRLPPDQNTGVGQVDVRNASCPTSYTVPRVIIGRGKVWLTPLKKRSKEKLGKSSASRTTKSRRHVGKKKPNF